MCDYRHATSKTLFDSVEFFRVYYKDQEIFSWPASFIAPSQRDAMLHKIVTMQEAARRDARDQLQESIRNLIGAAAPADIYRAIR